MSASPVPTIAQTWDRLRRPVWLYDPHTSRGVYANPPALALWGAETLEELLARDFSALSPAVKVRTDRLVALTADGGEVSERWTFYPKGQPVTVQASISAFRLDAGREVLLFEASPTEVDAGERRAVEALRHTSAIITLFDREGGRLFANPAAYGAYGSDDVEFAARFADPTEGEAMFAAAVAGQGMAGIYPVVAGDGRRWHHMDARSVTDPVTGAAGVLLNEQNVTARVEAEMARSAAEQKAAMSDARQRFLTDMSHELRTPLNAVIGFSGLLVEAGLEAGRTDQARRIHAAGQDLLTVVNRMIAQPDAEAAGFGDDQTGAVIDAGAAMEVDTSAQGLRVLYVDDNASNRTLVRAMLATQGIACETADDGALGVDAAVAGDWDLILMDIQMPVMDGVEAARRIRALDGPVGTTPIIALTANTLDEQVRGYFDAGMDDLIAKPVDMIELLTKVAHWAGGGRHAATGSESATVAG
jgi:CheY-like chemotaxis protein